MDNGSQFTAGATKAFFDEEGISNVYSAPYYPESNGQAESTNKTIMENIKKKLEKKKGYWHKHLLKVLWAYRTTPRTPTGESPFAMAFGMEAVLPTEVHFPTARTYMIEHGDNFGIQHFDVDTIEGRRDASQIRLEQYRQTWSRYYNKKVRPRGFMVGDLVLRKDFTKIPFSNEGKFRENYDGPYVIREIGQAGNYKLGTLGGALIDKGWNVKILKMFYK